MSYQKSITVRVDAKKYEKLERIAKELETSTSSIVRQAINKFLNN